MGARLLIQSIDGRRVEEELHYPFEQPRVQLGRSQSADVRLPHRTVSERHASIEQDGGHFRLTDHGSTNGTRVGGNRLVPHRATRVHDGDLIELGIYVLSFHDEMLLTAPLTAERTAELARRLLREQADGLHRPDTPAPRIVVISGPATGKSTDLPPPPCLWLVGTANHCQLVLDDALAAEESLELVRDLDGVLARRTELGPAVIVGKKSADEHRLKDGDELTIGQTVLLFEDPAEAVLDALSSEVDESVKRRKLPSPLPAPNAATSVADRDDATGAVAQEEAVGSPEAGHPDADSDAKPPRVRHSNLGADLIVYGLAGIVLAVSIAGLVLLLRTQ